MEIPFQLIYIIYWFSPTVDTYKAFIHVDTARLRKWPDVKFTQTAELANVRSKGLWLDDVLGQKAHEQIEMPHVWSFKCEADTFIKGKTRHSLKT